MRRGVTFLNVAMMLSSLASVSLMIAIVGLGTQNVRIALLTLVVSSIPPVILAASSYYAKSIRSQSIGIAIGWVCCAFAPPINTYLVTLAGRDDREAFLNSILTIALLFFMLFCDLKRVLYADPS